MTNMVEIGQNNFESSLNKSGDITRRPMDRVRRWLTAAVAGAVLTTGAGVTRDVRAESPNPMVDDSTKIESSSEGIETPESVLESQGISNPDNPVTEEGQITSKGVGDLLAGADEGVVTNFNAGVEVPNSDGGEVHYASNVTNENGEPVIVPLEGGGNSEVEKSQEELIIENTVGYLNKRPARTEKDTGYTDDDIKLRLITIKSEKIEDFGLIHTRNIQGIFLGCFENLSSDNLFLLLGVKDTKGQRFVTSVRVPLYVLEDANTPFKFTIAALSGLSLSSGGNAFQTKDRDDVTRVLNDRIGKSIVVNLYTDSVTKNDVKKYKKFGDNMLRYVDEMKKGIYYARSLDADVFRNGIKLEYPDPKLGILRIDPDLEESSIIAKLNSLKNEGSTTKSVPIILGMSSF